ncbi:MAG: thermonuclease family protein, partial [Actinomycetota bacterium]|nr:thermonuclease family protein [Actinomycetota bacterium]
MTRVIDGDTVEMERLGEVRLIGVDAPEEGRCSEGEATRFTRDRLEGEVVQYELGVERDDRYDRTLAYLTREGQMHNEALLGEGLAKVLTIPPNDKYAERFQEAEREARTTDVGVWRDKCDDRNTIRARRAAAERKRNRIRARRLRRARTRDQARRQRAADRRRAQQA